MRSSNHFGPHTTLREIAERSAGGRRVFDRVGLDYCCDAQRTLADACEDVQAPVDGVLETLEREYWSGRGPLTRERTRPSLRSRVLLVERVHDRSRKMMETIDEKLAHLGPPPEGTALAGVAAAFHVLRNEVDSRMDSEEHEIFGQLDDLGAWGTSMHPEGPALGLRLRLAREHHASIGALLKRLRHASHGCCNVPNLRQLCHDLRRFDRHLVHQVYLENEVLFRRALLILAAQERA
jgi:regulator of cell morphogenesis and NO signaling